MSDPIFLKRISGGVLVSLKVQPRASKNEVGETVGAELKIKVTAPPVDSAANEAVIHLLAQVLDCPRSSIQLLRGKTSRHKQVMIQGMSAEVVAAKLKS